MKEVRAVENLVKCQVETIVVIKFFLIQSDPRLLTETAKQALASHKMSLVIIICGKVWVFNSVVAIGDCPLLYLS